MPCRDRFLAQLFARVFGIEDLLIRDRYDPNFLCFFQDRNRLRNRARPMQPPRY